jgi:two-component system, NarL family, sensor histidine kinase DesK
MRFRLLPDSHLGWTPYAWLVYLSWFLLYAMFASRTPLDWALNGAALTVFLALYFRGFWLEGQALITVAFALVGLGVVMTPLNPGASSFFIYGAAFLGEAVRPVIAFRWLVLIMAIVAFEAWLVPLRPEAWLTGLILSGVIGGTNIHFAEVRRKDAALLEARQAAEHLAVVAERERIARDLHDLLGHTLSVIVLKSELASKVAERDPARALAEIRDVERISREALQEVRGAVRGYRAERIEDEVARGRAALAAIGVTVHADIAPLGDAGHLEPTLALAVREALTNVLRHARARHCEVVLEQHDDGLRLIVQDDGVGGSHVDGSGLSGMRARLAQIGGSVTVTGDRGTRVEMSAPRAPRAMPAGMEAT